MLRCPSRLRRTVIRLTAGVAVMLVVVGCGTDIKHPTANLVSGKVMFQKNCGSCHTLAHASTSGTTGPNLDDAFRQDRIDGVKSTSIQGLIDYWIRYPNTQGVMPQGIVGGQDAQDVAAYVAAVAAKPGKDTGALATAGGVTGTTPAAGKQVFTGVGGCGSCRDPPGVHPHRDRQAVRLHPVRVQGGRDAVKLRLDADAQRDHGARQLPVDRGEIGSSAAAARSRSRSNSSSPRPAATARAARRSSSSRPCWTA